MRTNCKCLTFPIWNSQNLWKSFHKKILNYWNLLAPFDTVCFCCWSVVPTIDCHGEFWLKHLHHSSHPFFFSWHKMRIKSCQLNLVTASVTVIDPYFRMLKFLCCALMACMLKNLVLNSFTNSAHVITSIFLLGATVSQQ